MEFDPSKIKWTREELLILKPDQVIEPRFQPRNPTFEDVQAKLQIAISRGAPEHEIDALETWATSLRWAGSNR